MHQGILSKTFLCNIAASNVSYSCPLGGVLSGTTCLKDNITTYTATAVYSCSSGVLSGINCITTVAATTAIAGYTISGNSLFNLGGQDYGLEKSGNNFRYKSVLMLDHG